MRIIVDIDALPNDTKVFIDSNIFIYHFAGMSEQCTQIIKKIETKKIDTYVSNIVIGEIIHRRMIAEAIEKRIVTLKNLLKKLKSNPELVKNLTQYSRDISNILLLPLNIISITIEDIRMSQTIRDEYGLMTNDSLNISCIKRLHIENIITHDNDFDTISDLKIWKPSDI